MFGGTLNTRSNEYEPAIKDEILQGSATILREKKARYQQQQLYRMMINQVMIFAILSLCTVCSRQKTVTVAKNVQETKMSNNTFPTTTLTSVTTGQKIYKQNPVNLPS